METPSVAQICEANTPHLRTKDQPYYSAAEETCCKTRLIQQIIPYTTLQGCGALPSESPPSTEGAQTSVDFRCRPAYHHCDGVRECYLWINMIKLSATGKGLSTRWWSGTDFALFTSPSSEADKLSWDILQPPSRLASQLSPWARPALAWRPSRINHIPNKTIINSVF